MDALLQQSSWSPELLEATGVWIFFFSKRRRGVVEFIWRGDWVAQCLGTRIMFEAILFWSPEPVNPLTFSYKEKPNPIFFSAVFLSPLLSLYAILVHNFSVLFNHKSIIIT